jgi:hypothetical protein
VLACHLTHLELHCHELPSLILVTHDRSESIN